MKWVPALAVDGGGCGGFGHQQLVVVDAEERASFSGSGGASLICGWWDGG